MVKTRAFSKKLIPGYEPTHYQRPVMEQAPIVKSWEEQKKEEALEFLKSQRGAIPGNYQYLQRVLGDINGGRLEWSLLTVEELQALLNQEWEFKQAAISMADDKEIQAVRAVMDAALAELTRQGGTWTEPSAPVRDDPVNPPNPPHDPTRGR